MSEEEEGGGVGTTLLIVGAVGCGGLVILAVVVALFWGVGSSSISMPPSAISVSAPTNPASPAMTTTVDLGNGDHFVQTETMPTDGTRIRVRITTIDGTPTELRVYWDALDKIDEARSGLYEDDARIRSLTAEERTELGG